MLTYSSTREKPTRPSKLRFGLLSAEEVRKIAVVRVKDTTLYYRGLPNSGGLLDPLMGSVDRRHLCASCMRDAKTCQGHVGYIELAYPMFHIGFIETVLKVLRTVCFTCSRLCATEEDIASLKGTNGRHRLLALHNILKGRKQCPHCAMTRPSFARVPLGIRIEWPQDMEWECEEEREYCTAHFTAKEALSILKNMTNEDCERLGFCPVTSHPKNMILQTLVVPPPCTRPAIYASEGSRSRGQNDLTVKLLDCLKRSLELEACLGCKWSEVKELSMDAVDRIARLQYEVFSIVNSNVRGYKPPSVRGGHAQKTLTDRLKGKEGRVRGNLMGKRVDFSARCVITPDPYFACDRVGVPYSIAKVLTVPETVNAINIRRLTRRVRLGSGDVKGAQCIIHVDGTVTNLSHTKDKDSIILRFGDVVERHLDDDDVVVFNRQPSLHKHGMQAHRVRLMPGYTFRLSLVVASPYNADFDGDEMNLHVPQSLAARAECMSLLSVTQNVIGPQSNKPTMGIVQDSLLGLHLLSLPGSVFSHPDTCRMIGATLRTTKTLDAPALVIRHNGATHRLWTGKQIFSKLLPKGLFVEPDHVSTETVLHDDATMVVRNGALLSGTLRKAHVGTASGGIVDVLCREYGGYCCCRFFDDAQRLTHAFLLIKGHEVGIHDVMLNREGHDRVSERLEKATHLCEEIQKEVAVDDVPADVALTAERSILRLLSKTLMQCGSIVNEHMDESNAIRRMVGGGSKGTFINLSQICAALGQQSLEGSRITAEKGDRTLPCFGKKDLSLASRGFVTNSYALGLSPTDLFFHAIGGREGLVDTAVKTSQTGYLQRRMNKSFEDHLTNEDGYIRNALGEIISFAWGSDGMHPALLERVKLSALSESSDSIRRRMTPNEADLFLRMQAEALKSKVHVLASELDQRVLLPFNPNRSRKHRQRLEVSEGFVSPEYASKRAIELVTRMRTPNVVGVAVLDLCCASSVAKLSTEHFDTFVTHLRDKIDAARCPPGESVGSLAAQSTGEPCTQMTLNSVDWNTSMVIHWTRKSPPPVPHNAEVGALIDALIEEHQNECQVQPDGKTIYLPLACGTATALSPDENGNMVWTELEAVTRHPPINKDGSNTLVEVTTDSGRTVTVTKGKSLLVERDGKLVQIDGDEVIVGDRVPVVQELPPSTKQDTLDLHTVFSETEAIFTNTMIEAMEAAKHNRNWFVKGAFKGRSCYSRSDILREAVKHRPNLLKADQVVWSHGGVFLPMRVPLDREFGFFVGGYLAEGCVTDHQVHISNVDPAYRDAARVWPDRYGIKHHVTNEKHQHKNNGTSISIMFHSTILVELMKRTCGRLSAGKRVPGFAFAAPDAFVRGLLDGYISGDGTVSRKQAMIAASSRSQKLRDGIALLLTRFKIHCRLTQTHVSSHVAWTTNEDGVCTQTQYGNMEPMYHLMIPAVGTRRFVENVDLTLAHKQERCDEILVSAKRKPFKTYDNLSNVSLEEIVALNEVASSHEFVYDLTVAGTRNMTAVNGLALADTFHFAGVSAKNVTLGIPKLKELVDACKTPKTPLTVVRFREPYSRSEAFASYVADTLPLTRLTDVVTRCDIIHDPDIETSTVEEDVWLVQLDRAVTPEFVVEDYSAYVVRMELHREVMRTRLLTPPTLRTMLRERLGDRAHVVSSEANAVSWVVRIRFGHVTHMQEVGNLAEDQGAIMIHRAANALLDTVLVCGHPRVTSAAAVPATRLEMSEGSSVAVDVEEEHAVLAYGTFLADCAASDTVAWERCTSNDVWEVLNTLGIEACAHVLFDQLKTVISFDGQYVDDRHLALIVDSMCRSGRLVPLNRHGINRADTSPLMRASFEETIDVLCDAAVYAETENARGVTTSIMTGQLAEFGSGTADVLFHESCLPKTREDVEQPPQRKRVMRSTCRSYIDDNVASSQTVEYVFSEVKPAVVRPLTPMEVESNGGGSVRQRVRFRPVSPPV